MLDISGDIVPNIRPFDPRSLSSTTPIDTNIRGHTSTSSCINSTTSNTLINTLPQRIAIDNRSQDENSKMHLDSLISSSSSNNTTYHHSFLAVDSALSPDHMASCSPCLISPYPAVLSSTMVNSPVSPPVMSPSTNIAFNPTNDAMESTKVFQFPPPTHLQSNSNIRHDLPPTQHNLSDSHPPLNTIKQEEWHVPCLQDNIHNPTNLHLVTNENRSGLPVSSGVQEPNSGLQQLCFPSVTTTTSIGLSQPDQGSPMAISPASLNTPRGSITSFKSHSQQHSPMNMDSIMTTFTCAPSSTISSTNAPSTTTTNSASTTTLSSLTQIDLLNEINASFTIQVPPSATTGALSHSCSTSNIVAVSNPGAQVTASQDDSMLPSYHDNTFNDSEDAYASYTMLQPSLMANTSAIIEANLQQPQHQAHHRFPSPPRSGYSSPVHNMGYSQNYLQHANPHTNPPPSYDQFMSSSIAMPMGNDSIIVSNNLGQNMGITNPADILSTNELNNLFGDGGLKPDPDMDIRFIQTSANDSIASKATIIPSGPMPDHESHFASDTCPETPDSSVKEEIDVNSPDTGSYVCLWLECNEEFDSPKAFVDHVNETHMDTRKGCEEFPCLWKVI